MVRDEAAIRIVRDLVPADFIVLAEYITVLGDPAFFVILIALFYWLVDRRLGIYLIGYGIGVLALTVGLKEFLMIPRPPMELQVIIEDGYGFPSGHAVGATAVYGVLALSLDFWSRNKRLVLAALLVIAISLSRVLLGVHYPIDVAAGIVLGIIYLTILVYLTGYNAERSIGLALLLAGLSALVPSPETWGVLGAGIGAAVAWLSLRDSIPMRLRKRDYVASLFGISVVAVLYYLAEQLGDPLWVFIIYFVLTAGIVALPAVSREVLMK